MRGPILARPETYTLATSLHPAPITTSRSTMQDGPMYASSAISAPLSTCAVGWICISTPSRPISARKANCKRKKITWAAQSALKPSRAAGPRGRPPKPPATAKSARARRQPLPPGARPSHPLSSLSRKKFAFAIKSEARTNAQPAARHALHARPRSVKVATNEQRTATGRSHRRAELGWRRRDVAKPHPGFAREFARGPDRRSRRGFRHARLPQDAGSARGRPFALSAQGVRALGPGKARPRPRRTLRPGLCLAGELEVGARSLRGRRRAAMRLLARSALGPSQRHPPLARGFAAANRGGLPGARPTPGCGGRILAAPAAAHRG